MLIDGKTVETSETDPVIDPSRGEPFANAPRATSAHLEEAIGAAERALVSWRKDEALRRAKLEECAEAVRARSKEIGELLTREQGKPIKNAVGEAVAAAHWLRYYAKLETANELLHDDAAKRVHLARKPHGVVAAITPWNFPVVLLAWKLAPGLLAGNTFVAKPSPFTPLSSLLFADVLRPILPPGVLNVLAGGNELGAELVRHPKIRKVAFTGSVMTGKRILEATAPDLKRVTLELGGNDAAIVLGDVDPAKVASALFWGAFRNSGQVCTAIKRLYVQEKVYRPLVDELVKLASRVKIGDGLEPETELGPINNAPQLARVTELVDDARKNGATIECGGARLDRPGYFYPPTIVTGALEGTRLVDEEQFGTALPVLSFTDVDEAIARANRSHFGLGASVWTQDLARGEALVQELDAGTGWVNHHGDLTSFAPFGGVKWSGMGYENGRRGYEEYTQLQTVSVKL